ncbi:MAG: hypothetical protein DWQ42_20790 [Planctomycetota bacterium]|nr:MAG: hypothetical protein DWQ42_20790 [Planctomycetota bacterium]
MAFVLATVPIRRPQALCLGLPDPFRVRNSGQTEGSHEARSNDAGVAKPAGFLEGTHPTEPHLFWSRGPVGNNAPRFARRGGHRRVGDRISRRTQKTGLVAQPARTKGRGQGSFRHGLVTVRAINSDRFRPGDR